MNELNALKELLLRSSEVIGQQGRLVVMSYHSLEETGWLKILSPEGNSKERLRKIYLETNIQVPFRALTKNRWRPVKLRFLATEGEKCKAENRTDLVHGRNKLKDEVQERAGSVTQTEKCSSRPARRLVKLVNVFGVLTGTRLFARCLYPLCHTAHHWLHRQQLLCGKSDS